MNNKQISWFSISAIIGIFLISIFAGCVNKQQQPNAPQPTGNVSEKVFTFAAGVENIPLLIIEKMEYLKDLI